MYVCIYIYIHICMHTLYIIHAYLICAYIVTVCTLYVHISYAITHAESKNYLAGKKPVRAFNKKNWFVSDRRHTCVREDKFFASLKFLCFLFFFLQRGEFVTYVCECVCYLFTLLQYP